MIEKLWDLLFSCQNILKLISCFVDPLFSGLFAYCRLANRELHKCSSYGRFREKWQTMRIVQRIALLQVETR